MSVFDGRLCPAEAARCNPLDRRLVLMAPEIRRGAEPTVMPQIFPRTSSGESPATPRG